MTGINILPGVYYDEKVQKGIIREGGEIPCFIGKTNNENADGTKITKYTNFTDISKSVEEGGIGATGNVEEDILTNPLEAILKDFYEEISLTNAVNDAGVPYIYVIDIGAGDNLSKWYNALETSKIYRDITIEVYNGVEYLHTDMQKFIDSAHVHIQQMGKMLDLRRIFFTIADKFENTSLKADETGKVTVTVADAISAKPLNMADVTFYGSVLQTDTDGKCVFENIPYGRWLCSVVCKGYDSYANYITVDSSEVEYSVDLKESEEIGVIKFTVSDNLDQPISNASVTIAGKTLTTDKDGVCIFEDLYFTIYRVTVQHEDYETYTKNIYLNESYVVYPVILTPKPASKGAINLKVTDNQTSEPISLAKVTIADKTLETDDKGKVVFENLLFDTYEVSIHHENYLDFKVSVTLDESVLSLEAKLVPYQAQVGNLNITVYDDFTSSPIESAKVTLNGESLNTDSDGKCVFKGLAYDRYMVTVEHENYNTSTQYLTVYASEVYYDINLYEIGKTGNINVLVTDKDDSKAIENAKVTIAGKTLTTDSDGKCVFEELSYNTYDIKVVKDAYLNYTDSVVLDDEEVDYEAKIIKISSGNLTVAVVNSVTSEPVESAKVTVNKTTIETDETGKCVFKDLTFGTYTVKVIKEDYFNFSEDIVLDSVEYTYTANINPVMNGNINITVIDENSNPVEYAEVTLADKKLITDKDGKCVFEDLPYSTYHVKIEKEYYADLVDSIVLNNAEVDYTARLTPIEIGNINITVINNDTGVPIESAEVTINDKKLITDADGKCVFKDLDYGGYDVKVTKYDFYDFTDNITLITHELDYTAKINPVRYGDINVTVINAEKEPLPETEVKLGDTTLTTDEDGVCTFSHLKYEEYLISISKTYYKDYNDIITVDKAILDYTAELVNDTGDINFYVVNADTKMPVESANININEETLTTDKDGKCTIEDLKQGVYDLKVVHRDYKEYSTVIDLCVKELNIPIELTPVVIIDVTDEDLIELAQANIQYNRLNLAEPLLFGKTIGRFCVTPIGEEAGYYVYNTVQAGTFKDRTPEQKLKLQQAGVIFNADEYSSSTYYPKINLGVATCFGNPVDSRPADALDSSRRIADYILEQVFDACYPQIKARETRTQIAMLQTKINIIVTNAIDDGLVVAYNENTNPYGTVLAVEESDSNPYAMVVTGNIQPINCTIAIEVEATITQPAMKATEEE